MAAPISADAIRVLFKVLNRDELAALSSEDIRAILRHLTGEQIRSLRREQLIGPDTPLTPADLRLFSEDQEIAIYWHLTDAEKVALRHGRSVTFVEVAVAVPAELVPVNCSCTTSSSGC